MRGRWPPIYDADDLRRTIRDVVQSGRLLEEFFQPSPDGPPVCQGDVVRLAAGVPVLDREGVPAIHEDAGFWLVIGNTCDFARDVRDVPWTQLVPITAAESSAASPDLGALRRFELSRMFYVPPWSTAVAGGVLGADLLRPVALHRHAFEAGKATVEARLTYHAWILLHCCLVRFLARDDGRFDT